jgi:hypothetical protein
VTCMNSAPVEIVRSGRESNLGDRKWRSGSCF